MKSPELIGLTFYFFKSPDMELTNTLIIEPFP
jgi:hypothetical protein